MALHVYARKGPWGLPHSELQVRPIANLEGNVVGAQGEQGVVAAISGDNELAENIPVRGGVGDSESEYVEEESDQVESENEDSGQEELCL